MKAIRTAGIGLATIGVLAAGCANEPARPYNTGPYDSRQGTYDSRQSAYGQGVVDRIEVVRKGDSNNIAGTVIGGIAGGLIGHQIGSGRGNTAATIIGGVGGAVAGREVQNRSRGADETFRVTVRMENGATEVVRQEDIRDLRPGDRVRVENGRVYRL
jgi:outer membrane lipoprotein SlyB